MPHFHRSRLFASAVSAVSLGFCLLNGSHAYAQSTFVTSGKTLDTDTSATIFFVGKDNAADFKTLPGTIVLTVKAGATILSPFEGPRPQGVRPPEPANPGPHGTLNVYGAHQINILGGKVDSVFSFDTSSLNLSGGNVSTMSSYGTSIATLAAGEINNALGKEHSTLNLSGAKVDVASGNDNSVVNISKGTVTTCYGSGDSKLSLRGGSVKETRLRGNSVLTIYGTGLSRSPAREVVTKILASGSNSRFRTNRQTFMVFRYTECRVSGTLQNGQKLDGLLVRDYEGGLSFGDSKAGTGNLRLVNVPQ